MSTWLDHWDQRYTDRVRLLVEILPVLASEPGFALKGGTAINLFEHDLPRLSVDIDLAWLPVHGYAEDAKLIADALGRLANTLRARPLQLQVHASAGEGGVVTRLVASRGRARVQIETTPVMRGAVHPVRTMVVRPRVEEAFGFAEVQMLAPRVPTDFEATFEAHFKGMTSEPIDVAALLESRERLLARVAHWLDGPSRAFLQSVEDEKPDFSLIGLAHAAELPGVRRKLHNLAQRTAAKRAADRQQLEETLAQIAGAR